MASQGYLAVLPKAHNRVHLDGAMRPETLRELSEARGLVVPEIRGHGSFAHFAETIAAVQAVLATRADIERMVEELVEDNAADGALWLEVSLWPGALPDAIDSSRQRIELVLDAGRRAAKRHNIGFGVMVAALRDNGPEEAIELVHLAVSLRDDGIVSFGLDGDESRFPPSWFESAFRVAKRGDLLCTPHAGELAGPQSVRDAIQVLGAHRILHGVRAVEDPGLLQELAERGVCLDICPTSNVMLSVAPRLDVHPLPPCFKQVFTAALTLTIRCYSESACSRNTRLRGLKCVSMTFRLRALLPALLSHRAHLKRLRRRHCSLLTTGWPPRL